MPSFDDVLDYFSGSILLMVGQAKGLKRFDLSADGFWQSFFAILVALPPVALSWIEFEMERTDGPDDDPGIAAAYVAHAFADCLAWVLPVFILLSVARYVGYERKVVPVVVATNWSGALLAWVFSPYWLLLVLVGPDGVTGFLGVLVTIASIVLTVRLIYTAAGKDPFGAAAITLLMVVSSLMSYGAVMDVTGVRLF